MPLYKNIDINAESKIGIWKITESLNELLNNFSIPQSEKESFELIKSDSRKIQWVVIRKMLLELTNNQELYIGHYDNRKPYLNDDKISISISHTQNFVALFLSKGINVGIDIEKLHPRIYKIRTKFCSEQENNYLTDDDSLLQRLYVIWSAKEALFKIYGEGNLDFRKNLNIHPFDYGPPGKIKTNIKCNNLNTEIDLFYDQIDDHVLVYGMSHLK